MFSNQATTAAQTIVTDSSQKSFYFRDVTTSNKESYLTVLPDLCARNKDLDRVLRSVAITVCQKLTPPKAIAILLANYPKDMSSYLNVFLRLLEAMWEFSVAEFRKKSPGANPGKWEICFLLLEVLNNEYLATDLFY